MEKAGKMQIFAAAQAMFLPSNKSKQVFDVETLLTNHPNYPTPTFFFLPS